MPCVLELRSQRGTGWRETWAFNGRDERELRDCLDQLDEFAIESPVEPRNWPSGRGKHPRSERRWLAAVLLWPDEPQQPGLPWYRADAAEAAWTIAGALRLAELLPGRLDDVRVAIVEGFTEGQSTGPPLGASRRT